MLRRQDLVSAFRQMDLDRRKPVIVHASLRSFGPVEEGADTVVAALLEVFQTVVMPVFTYKTMVIPEIGPAGNGITYGSGRHNNRLAEFFRSDMPADRLMGMIPETLRKHPEAQRTRHPILSFAGIHAGPLLAGQTRQEPLGPIHRMADGGGWVLLMGVDHTANTSIHYAERLAGRRQFLRWALTPEGIQECPGFPGCSHGFNAIAPHIESSIRRVRVGQGLIQAVSLVDLTEAVYDQVHRNPHALLCSDPRCERCRVNRHT